MLGGPEAEAFRARPAVTGCAIILRSHIGHKRADRKLSANQRRRQTRSCEKESPDVRTLSADAAPARGD